MCLEDVTDETPKWTQFETTTCSRCAGTGTYSWTRDWGNTCFKCGFKPRVPGRGEVRTARGQQASDFLGEILSRPLTEVRVGDLYLYRHLSGVRKFHRVLAIEETTVRWAKNGVWRDDPALRITLSGKVAVTSYLSSEETVRIGVTQAHKQAAIALALRYQECLTKTGKERKAKKYQQEIATIREEAEALWDQRKTQEAA